MQIWGLSVNHISIFSSFWENTKNYEYIFVNSTRFGPEEPGASPPSRLTLLGFLMRFIHLSKKGRPWMVFIDWILELSPLHWQNTETHSYPVLPQGNLTSDLWHSRAQSCTVGPFCAWSDAAEVRSRNSPCVSPLGWSGDGLRLALLGRRYHRRSELNSVGLAVMLACVRPRTSYFCLISTPYLWFWWPQLSLYLQTLCSQVQQRTPECSVAVFNMI